jgi:hypothetical protein
MLFRFGVTGWRECGRFICPVVDLLLGNARKITGQAGKPMAQLIQCPFHMHATLSWQETKGQPQQPKAKSTNLNGCLFNRIVQWIVVG